MTVGSAQSRLRARTRALLPRSAAGRALLCTLLLLLAPRVPAGGRDEGGVWLEDGEPVAPGPYPAPLAIAQKLPKYCYPQYFRKSGPGYGFPPSCNAMNHYCPGLVALYQSYTWTDKTRKRGALLGARQNFSYTLKNMGPKCPLRREVQGNLQGAEFQLKLYER